MASSKPKILVVLTSVDAVPKSGKKIGWYLPELAHPHEVLHGKADLTFASPKGGVAPLDPSSVEMFSSDPVCKAFFENHKQDWEQTVPLSSLAGRASEFDAVFFPGGHGPMFDLVGDEDSLRLVQDFAAQGKVISAVCHGPAALLNARGADGKTPLLRGREVTGFSDEAEKMFKFDGEMDFSLEDRLAEVSGGHFVKSDEGPMGEKVVVSGNVITGQNPASSKEVGVAIAKALGMSYP
ncbi:ThiJ/PfpI family protein [Sodiomyces alkalinus F11]|uniref:D-lactate dehydratase n=1 Tax=Sodiomyces alkalinus (strain CBS 110278 / VKM F-3762 / F11) TaxID=1314773 RepID=A0A3N2PX38_SODAK|nr:ThiJ/PfpI family protein [Sodiomyces alkalinus F11]ROT39052.1 ThiJ/PfpI family protein [Sodiomyces alkalinus F11]